MPLISSNDSYHSSHNHIPRVRCLPPRADSLSHPSIWTHLKIVVLFLALTLVTRGQSLTIPDQQTVVGKFYHYQIQLSSSHDLKFIKVGKAGEENRLPDWLHFNEDTLELIGIPFEKGLFFIEVQVKYYGKQQWNDIFAIEVTDGSQLQAVNHLSEYRCLLRIKQPFETINSVWRLINSLKPRNTLSNMNPQIFADWLQRFSVSRNTDSQYLISYEIEDCETNQLHKDRDSADGLRTKLTALGFESDVVQITRRQFDDIFSDMIDSSAHSHRIGDNSGRPNSHYRRNVADSIHHTPVLAPNWMTLTTSTIIGSTDNTEPSERDPLSRVLIPSMVSPTLQFSPTPSSLPSADPIENSILGGHEHRHHHIKQNKFQTPVLYTTPVLAPERPTIIEAHEDLFTPIPVTRTPSLQSPHLPSDTIVIAPSPSVVPEISTSRIEVTTEEEMPTTSSAEIPSTPSMIPNKTPYINKRIRKMEMPSGKYWKYTIPAETFVDFEDGDTRRLKLTFLMSTSSNTQEQPVSDFWIQFDHENQYLYAFPTDEDVGKHYFNLVAVDSSGAHVTETLEVHVRQHKNTRAFTHIFTLTDVYWDSFQFACLIEATSSLLKRVTTRVFGDADINTIAVQKIIKNEKENTWTISWTNDSLLTHPCPREMIQHLYAKLHDSDKVYEDSSAEPSRLLRQSIAPEFKVQRVQMNFVAKSACGSYELPDIDDRKPKENPVFRNRIGKLGPFRLGEAFKFRIPEDTVFSPPRQVGTRELSLTLRPIEPPQLPDFIYFDPEDQELFGLTLNKERIGSYELNLIAEDTISGGTANDIFSIDIIDQISDQSKQPAFEIVINLLGPPGRDELTVREKVDIIQRISSGMFADGDSSAVQILSIDRFQYDGLAPGGDDNNYLDAEPETSNEDESGGRRHKHKEEDAPLTRHTREATPLHYFAFKWTNRTISGHDNCPKDAINENIYKRLFERSYDSLKSLKEVFEPNYDLINVEFEPIGTCKNTMSPKMMGPRPIPATSTPPPIYTPTRGPPREEEDIDNAVDMEESNEFLLTTIIPPVAILIALIFAAIVGCCFHRANKRRKSVEISSRLPGESGLNEREAFLQKGRIPIIFEFEQQQQQQQNASQPQSQQFNMNPVIMPPSQPPHTPQHHPQQQMTPLRQLSSAKPSYQALPQSGSQRRQPPPYYK